MYTSYYTMKNGRKGVHPKKKKKRKKKKKNEKMGMTKSNPSFIFFASMAGPTEPNQ